MSFGKLHEMCKEANIKTNKRMIETVIRYDTMDKKRNNKAGSIKAEAAILRADQMLALDPEGYERKCVAAAKRVEELASQTAEALRVYRGLVPLRSGNAMAFAVGHIGIDPLWCNAVDGPSNVGYEAMKTIFDAGFTNEELLHKGQQTSTGRSQPQPGQDRRLLHPQYRIHGRII